MISLVGICLLLAAAQPASAAAPTLDGAKWIWAAGANDAAGTWAFQKGFAFPAGEKPKKAEIIITCDNLWTLYVNGTQAGKSDAGANSWGRPQVVDVSKHLVIEQNAIAIEGTNTIPGPAGLIAKLHVEFEDGKTEAFELVTDKTWIATAKPEETWKENGFTPGDGWKPVAVIGNYGIGPWNKVTPGGKVPKGRQPAPANYAKEEKFEGPVFKDGVVFVGNSQSFGAKGQPTYVQYIRGTRAYFEMDPMTPAAIGTQLYSLIPFRPDGKATLLCDAEGGRIGSPSVSYDGRTVYFAMAKGDEAYYHLYAVNPDGKNLRQITDGPFHDYDPMEMPDGRIVFSSTRLGSREEYHAKYASSLFTCKPDGTNIRPLTYHIVADREPRITSNGSLVFLRSDNFLERAKVEVQLHQTRLDGTAGQVIIGPGRKGVQHDRDAAAEHPMRWLRNYGAGSPAPLPDGRVAAINQKGLVTSAETTGKPMETSFLPYDLSPLPDGRLLCTSIQKRQMLVFDPESKEAKQVVSADDLPVTDFHSVVHLGARTRPQVRPSMVDPTMERSIDKTGFLYCQNVYNTQHTSADVKRIKAIRIYEGRPFTLEPTKTIYAHIGTIGAELGTVPLEKDGSFYAEVPADRPLAMQAVDGEGRAVINELTWVYTRPGEQRACVGCHASVDAAPARSTSLAVMSRPMKLLGQGTPHRFRADNGANGGIVNLQLDRFREMAAVNLYDIPDDDQLSTIRRLGILRNRSAVPTLVAALKSPVDEVRCAAALSLSACGDRGAVEPLTAALKDRSKIVVRAVENALEHITGNPAGTLDFDAAEAAAIERLSAADPADVQLGLETLGHIGGKTGKKAIRQYLENNPDGELRIQMAAMRSLGYLEDAQAVPLLVKIMNDNLTKKGKGGFHETGFGQKPIYLSATAAEALGRIGGDDAEKAILDAMPRLNHFSDYVFRTAEHGWLQAVISSPVHFRMLEALERINSTKTGPLTGMLIISLPIDKDRGLLYELDTYERLTARTIARSGRTPEVVETCLSILGDGEAKRTEELVAPISTSPHAERHVRPHSPQARAAQVLSIVCDDVKYADRIRALLEKYRAEGPSETRSWCCFMLTRALGRLGDDKSADLFIDMLANDPAEAQLGLNPPPTHIIYKAWRPFYRPAAAWSLGELKSKAAVPVLIGILKDLDNASSTREQAARALGKIGDAGCVAELTELAQEYPEVTTRRAILESLRELSSK